MGEYNVRIHLHEVRQRLVQARKRKYWSQRATAALLGIHRPTLSYIEGGTQTLTVEMLLKLAHLYNVGVLWLMFGD